MRLANGIVLDKDTTFGELKFSALRREVRIQNEDGSVSDEIKERTYDLKSKQGVKYFSELLASSERLGVDLESVIQSYNYGGGFLGYVANRGNKYTFELAQSFSKEYSGDEKVSYPNPIAIQET